MSDLFIHECYVANFALSLFAQERKRRRLAPPTVCKNSWTVSFYSQVRLYTWEARVLVACAYVFDDSFWTQVKDCALTPASVNQVGVRVLRAMPPFPKLKAQLRAVSDLAYESEESPLLLGSLMHWPKQEESWRHPAVDQALDQLLTPCWTIMREAAPALGLVEETTLDPEAETLERRWVFQERTEKAP